MARKKMENARLPHQAKAQPEGPAPEFYQEPA